MSPLNAAQIGGASGLGFEDTATQETISDVTNRADQAGVSRSEAGDFSTGKAGVKTLSQNESRNFVQSFGLEGILDPNSFRGLTAGEANRRGLEERRKRLGQISANTTFTFNPDTLKGTKKLVDRLNLSLNEINNDPFASVGTKKDKMQAAIEMSSKEFAKLFDSPEQFNDAIKYEPRIAETFAALEKMGATAQGVQDSIPTAPAQPQVDNSRLQAVQGLMSQGVKDPNQMLNYLNFDETGKQIGDFTAEEVSSLMAGGSQKQDPSTYLANLRNPKVNQTAQDNALNELIPERELSQAEIARQARIPEEYRNLYFGSETEIGIFNQKKAQAEEEVRLLEEKEKDDKATYRMKADTAIARKKAEQKVAEAEIERNRLSAKNYMTGMLAKLGALNTTGAAAQALATVESNYQIAKQKMATTYKFDIRSLEDTLYENINTVENTTSEKILKLEQDLTKDYEDISKEILKLEQASEKEIFDITTRYAEKLRTRTDSHTDELKKAAEKWAKEYGKKASNVDFTASGVPGSKSTIVSETEQRLEASRGGDGYVNSEVYSQVYKDWIARGGTATTFKARFPTANYVNPQDMSLPPQLRYAKPSQTIPKETSGFKPLF